MNIGELFTNLCCLNRPQPAAGQAQASKSFTLDGEKTTRSKKRKNARESILSMFTQIEQCMRLDNIPIKEITQILSKNAEMG